jgi:hypothetical protein
MPASHLGGIRLGAADQRASDLHELLLWSLSGLGVATIMAGVLGRGRDGGSCSRSTRSPPPPAGSRKSISASASASTGPTTSSRSWQTPSVTWGRLDLAFASQRRFVASAAHELRTPLTSARTLIDVAMAKPAKMTGHRSWPFRVIAHSDAAVVITMSHWLAWPCRDCAVMRGS